MSAKQQIQKLIGQNYKIEHPRDPKFGDYSVFSKNTQEIIAKTTNNPMFEKVEAIGNFVNFYLSQNYLRKIFRKIKTPKIGKEKIMVEFISANPTGPLHIGNGRGAFIGDCLANILKKIGYKVYREYYINDSGKQIEDLKKGAYKNETRTAEQIQKDNQKFIEKKLKIKFDRWFSEKSLYDSGEINKVLVLLKKKKLTYKKGHALWFKSSQLGDDKDRVLIKKDGRGTYILGDIAYHRNKFEKRKFAKSINLWGADHHGDIKRLQAGVEALGHKGKLDIILMQLVSLIRDGLEVKMSKRQGIYVTLEELINEVGLDAARFFFLMNSVDRHMDFDLNLAKEKSEKNPVYYVQYAHARICSILSKIQNTRPQRFACEAGVAKYKIQELSHPAEFNLIRQLIKFPEILEEISKTYQVQKLPHYAIELAKRFHCFYKQCRVIGGSKERLELVRQTKKILKQILELMSINAPEKM